MDPSMAAIVDNSADAKYKENINNIVKKISNLYRDIKKYKVFKINIFLLIIVYSNNRFLRLR